MEPKFRVEFLDEAVEFMENLTPKVRRKIYYNLKKAQIQNDKTIFKKLSKDIWEFRTLYQKTYYRLFAFWNKLDKNDTLVIATHGIEKKSGKISKNEIEKAKKIRRKYFEELKND